MRRYFKGFKPEKRSQNLSRLDDVVTSIPGQVTGLWLTSLIFNSVNFFGYLKICHCILMLNITSNKILVYRKMILSLKFRIYLIWHVLDLWITDIFAIRWSWRNISVTLQITVSLRQNYLSRVLYISKKF